MSSNPITDVNKDLSFGQVRTQASQNHIEINVEYNSSQKNYSIVRKKQALDQILKSQQIQRRPITSNPESIYIGYASQKQQQMSIRKNETTH
jgi:arsenate reductase-like glutaredoxin family protein